MVASFGASPVGNRRPRVAVAGGALCRGRGPEVDAVGIGGLAHNVVFERHAFRIVLGGPGVGGILVDKDFQATGVAVLM